jgi:ferredoxin
MKACPTSGLQPAFLEAGLEGVWTTHLVPRIGACEQHCNQCGKVCPTGAIRNLSLEEKQYARIGTAVIFRQKCLAWEQLRLCLVCDEVCPYDAVDFRVVTDHTGTLQRPFVNEDKCTGCGLCEHHCPVDGQAAIYVERLGEERKASGSYITPAKRRLRELADDRGTDYFGEYEEGLE